MILTFGGYPVCDAVTERRNLTNRGQFVPPELARANSFLNPLGEAPARGWICMLRADLNALDLNALHSLLMVDEGGRQIELRNLVFVQARKILPGKSSDTNAAYLVEIADSRWRVCNPYYSIPLNKQYNTRAPGWGGAAGASIYYADSLNTGSAWTWQTLLNDIWSLMATQLGTAPTLPFTPDGTPEGWRFVGIPAWKALCQILWRVGCAVRADLTQATGQYSYVRVGAADAVHDLLESQTTAASRLIGDDEIIEGVRGRVPAGVRVFFHRLTEHYGTEETTARDTGQWITTPVYSVDVAAPSTVLGAETGTNHPLWDDLPAIYNAAGALQNGTALTTRATERRDDFYRMIRSVGGGRMHRIFTGLAAFRPGSTIKGVAWRQDEQGGLTTEIVRHPWRMLKVGDAGEWSEEFEESSKLHSPDLRPTFPVYPHITQILEIANGTPSGGLYDCTVERPDGTGSVASWSDRESVWAIDLASAASLTAGDKYLGRLVGFASSRPVYAIRSASGISGVTVREVDLTPSVSGVTTMEFDQADGFVVSNPSAGVAKVKQTAASASAVGYVTTGAQTYAGEKTFNNTVIGFGNLNLSGYVEANYYELHQLGTVAAGTHLVTWQTNTDWVYVYNATLPGTPATAPTGNLTAKTLQCGTGKFVSSDGSAGAGGSFVSGDSPAKTITVKDGIITSIV